MGVIISILILFFVIVICKLLYEIKEGVDSLKSDIKILKHETLYWDNKLNDNINEVYKGIFLETIPTLENLIHSKVLPAIDDLNIKIHSEYAISKNNYDRLETDNKLLETEIKDLKLLKADLETRYKN